MSSGENSNENPRTVLVVDDEPDVLQLIEAMLTGNGYAVVTAGSAERAIELFENMPRPPDLLLTDVVMPGMSGPMLVDQLLAKQANLKVLFMSGYDHRQIVQRYVVEKGFRLITKPITLRSLRAAVKAEIDASQQEERKAEKPTG